MLKPELYNIENYGPIRIGEYVVKWIDLRGCLNLDAFDIRFNTFALALQRRYGIEDPFAPVDLEVTSSGAVFSDEIIIDLTDHYFLMGEVSINPKNLHMGNKVATITHLALGED